MSNCFDEPWLLDSREPKTLRDGFGNVVFVDDVQWLTYFRVGSSVKTLFGFPVLESVFDVISGNIDKTADKKTAAMKRRWKTFR